MNSRMHVAFTMLLLAATAGAAGVDNLVEAGNRLWTEGDLVQAEATYREAISLEPGTALPHARLAGLLLSQNRNDEARTEYQNAIMNDPEDPGLFLALAIVYLHEKSYSNARAMVDMAMELDPGKADAVKLHQYITSRMGNQEGIPGETAEAPLVAPQDAVHGSAPDRATDMPHYCPLPVSLCRQDPETLVVLIRTLTIRS
ncbi:MAG TPA: tetratricopeptide repeat protein [Gammaproteobacteria bacterium]|nr:tetratricopeptide repeat protein [Gammaproteobacteria bacterium]